METEGGAKRSTRKPAARKRGGCDNCPATVATAPAADAEGGARKKRSKPKSKTAPKRKK